MNPNTGTHQEPVETVAKASALARHLVEIASVQETHRIALQALLSAYAAVAVCHPCCAGEAARMAREVANLIETYAAPEGAAHVH